MLEDSLPLEDSVLREDSPPVEDSAAEGSELVEDSLPLEDSLLEDDFAVCVAVALGAAFAALSFALERAAWSPCELEPADLAVALAVELPAPVVVEAALTVLPENVWAATADSTPVRVTLPAISQRLTRVSLRSAASLDFTS